MSQSLVKNYLHIIFSTKHRAPTIHPDIEKDLHSYIGGLCNQLGCQTIQIGGFNNHIHILCILSKKIALMKLMEIVKSHSSKWIKSKGPDFENFYWQNGYGAFSVSQHDIPKLINYISNQHLHHAKINFEDEFRKTLNENKVDYNERYVWD